MRRHVENEVFVFCLSLLHPMTYHPFVCMADAEGHGDADSRSLSVSLIHADRLSFRLHGRCEDAWRLHACSSLFVFLTLTDAISFELTDKGLYR